MLELNSEMCRKWQSFLNILRRLYEAEMNNREKLNFLSLGSHVFIGEEDKCILNITWNACYMHKKSVGFVGNVA